MVPAVKPTSVHWRRAAVVAGASTVVGATVHLAHQHHRSAQSPAPRCFKVPLPLIEGLQGAVGELAQVCILYPLETVKGLADASGKQQRHQARVHASWLQVRCQADGISAREVAKAMLAEHGAGIRLFRQLYSGFAAAAGLSLLVGAVHWFSFCSAKRAALDNLPKLQEAAAEKASTGPAVLSVAAGVVPELEQAVIQYEEVHLHHHSHSQVDGSVTSEGDMSQRTSANAIAATVGAFCTALVESPIELFRHQAQAGIISGNLGQEMARAVRNGGPGALWTGFLPFLIEALPYDMCELGSYSQLRDLWVHNTKPGGRFHGLSQQVSEHAVDLLVGAAAGAAAVIISMPFDCIKTYLQTRDMGARYTGVRGQLALFLGTGMRMVKRRGLGALYVGMIPRLVQQVPSSTICWWAVERCGKFLEPITDREGYTQTDSHAGGGTH